MIQSSGSVIMAPHVLVRLVELALREVPGIARSGIVPRTRSSHRGEGVALKLADGAVAVDCYLVAQADAPLLELGMAVQATVAAVIRELAGMAVDEVNVYIQDVEAHRG